MRFFGQAGCRVWELGREGAGEYLRFLNRPHSRRQKPARRSRPTAYLLARQGLPIMSESSVEQFGLDDRLLLIPSCRVRAVLKGILIKRRWSD